MTAPAKDDKRSLGGLLGDVFFFFHVFFFWGGEGV